MEYAPNGEVFDYLVTNGRMKEKEARAKFRQLVSAVEYCHCKKIVHRDLKAENLLLDKDFNIKLADFGFSNFYDGENKLDTFCGSPPYAAPELFQGQKYYGPEVDCWSLGVILYTLVSGSLPFDAQHLKELQSRVIRGKYRVPFYMSTDCELLLRKLLVINPSKRKPLKTIMSDRWLNLGYEDNILEPYIEPPPNYNDPVRLAIMQKMGYSPEEVHEALEKQSFNNVTAIYLLLADPKTQRNLPEHSFVRSSRGSKTEQSTPSRKSVVETAEQSAPNLDVLTAESTPSRTSKTVNVENSTNNASVKLDALNNTDRKPSGISWLKQSSSAGPASSRTGESPIDNVSSGLPRIQLVDVSNNDTTGAGHLDNETSTTDAAWIRRNNTFTVKKIRPSGSDTAPPDQSCPLSRAPQFSNIPNHLVSDADDSALAAANTAVTASTTAADEDSMVLPTDASTELLNLNVDSLRVTTAPEQSNTAPPPVVTTVATPYQRKNPTFSCHRPRTKDSGSPVRTAPAPAAAPTVDPSPVVRVDSNYQFNVVDMLNPEARHQFARNCPERSTVAVPSARRPGFPATKQTGGTHLPLAADHIADKTDSTSSASTMSQADTLNGSSANTLNSDATHKRMNTPQTPKKTTEFTLPSEVVVSISNSSSGPGQDYKNSPRMKLPAVTIPPVISTNTPSPVTRDPMTQWSMRLRVAGPTEKPRTNEPSSAASPSTGQATSVEPYATTTTTITSAAISGPSASNPSNDGPPTLTSAKPYHSTPTKPGQFFRRITSRLSRNHTHGRADENKRTEELDARSGSDHPTACSTGPQMDVSDSHTGIRLATDVSRTGSTGDLVVSHHPHPVDPWTARQRQHRPKSSVATSKHATIAVTSTAGHDPESHSSGTDAQNGYQGDSADDTTLTARENEPFIPRKNSEDLFLVHLLFVWCGFRRPRPGTDLDPIGGNVGATGTSSSHKPSKPRRLHFVYRLRVIGRDPETLLKEIVRVLNQNGISYVHRNEFCLSCTTASQPQPPSSRRFGYPDSASAATTGGAPVALSTAVGGGEEDEDLLISSDPQNVSHVKWEIEVCRLGKPKSRYGVKFKRVSGDPDAFKQLEQALTRQFNLPPA
ncbi:MAP/microtubule affinity-regulating kinase 3 [Fasciola gigantica]|uniref:non-specific serine/threonine protein kinase n=1 Tax=Fasciola gigantica TaxID=46835 RepID=A0A504YCS8_FASGI|nr:MAP/microtubule affinity-regulating kinase 3 [Fasciola gigantica]